MKSLAARSSILHLKSIAPYNIRVLIIGGILFASGCQRFDIAVATQVVERIRAGDLVAGENGKLMLPPDMQHLSAHGAVYVKQVGDGPLSVLFISSGGKGSNLRGYLYCDSSDRLQQGDTWRVRAPINGPPEPLRPETTIVDVVIESERQQSWYVVSYSLD